MKIVLIKDKRKPGAYYKKHEEFADRYRLSEIVEWCETFPDHWDVEIRNERKELLWKRD